MAVTGNGTAADAVVLLDRITVDRLTDALRGANMTFVRVEAVGRELVKELRLLRKDLKQSRKKRKERK